MHEIDSAGIVSNGDVRADNGEHSLLNVSFYGVRGSTPCCDDSVRDFGGNTACVLVEADGHDPIICDMGTGLTYLGRDLMRRPSSAEPFRATLLASHLHWDHIQGLPFFQPMLTPGAEVEIIGPRQDGTTLAEAFGSCIQPPVFPVSLADLPGSITFRESHEERFEIGSLLIESFPVLHVGPTNGYRINSESGSVVFICDHQQPYDGSLNVPADVVAVCEGADVLIHDSQYDAEEFARKSDWGHCTPDFALELARQANVRRLVLFHHDPTHDDDWIRNQVCRLQMLAGGTVEVLAAYEGLKLVSGS